jgi:hypothetical protein
MKLSLNNCPDIGIICRVNKLFYLYNVSPSAYARIQWSVEYLITNGRISEFTLPNSLHQTFRPENGRKTKDKV